MLLEFALVAGMVYNGAKAADAVVKEKRSADIKESIDHMKSLRSEIRKALVYLGMAKSECCYNEVYDFLKVLEKYRTPTNDIILKAAYSPLPSSGRTLIDSIKPEALQEIKNWKQKNNDMYIFFAVNGFNTPLQKNVTNKTVKWLTFPTFSATPKEKGVILGGNIDDLMLAATNFPHTSQVEKSYREVLKDEKKRSEFGLAIENACIPLERLRKVILGITHCLDEERKTLAQITEKLKVSLKIPNRTDYAVETMAEVLLMGIRYCLNMWTLISSKLLDEDGFFSDKLQEFLVDEEFEWRFLSEKPDFTRFDHYYHDYVDFYTVDETHLSEYNIKIIFSERFGSTAKYLSYRLEDNDKRWKNSPGESELISNRKFHRITRDVIEDLVKQIRLDLVPLGVKKTTMYFFGEKEIFDLLSKTLNNKYGNCVEKIYMGD